jgi:hypothetical protein
MPDIWSWDNPHYKTSSPQNQEKACQNKSEPATMVEDLLWGIN